MELKNKPPPPPPPPPVLNTFSPSRKIGTSIYSSCIPVLTLFFPVKIIFFPFYFPFSRNLIFFHIFPLIIIIFYFSIDFSRKPRPPNRKGSKNDKYHPGSWHGPGHWPRAGWRGRAGRVHCQPEDPAGDLPKQVSQLSCSSQAGSSLSVLLPASSGLVDPELFSPDPVFRNFGIRSTFF